MAIADTHLLQKSRGRYVTLAFSCVLLGGWLLTWTFARWDSPTRMAQASRWVVLAGAVPMLLTLLGCAIAAARCCLEAQRGDPHAAYNGWRLGRFVYRLFAGTVVLLLLLSLLELVFSPQWRPGTLIGLLGAGVWGGWFLSAMRDQINLFGQAAGPPAAPVPEQGSSAEP